MDGRHEALAVLIDQRAAFAAQRFGGERRGVAADIERGRVELHEFGVGDDGADTGRHAHPLPAGFPGIGGDGIEMADATRAQHHGAGREDGALLRLAGIRTRDDAGDEATLAHQLLDHIAFQHADGGGGAHGGDQGFHDRLAGHVALDAHDAALGMGGLARQDQLALEIAVEGHAIAEQIMNAIGSFRHHQPRDLGIDNAGTGGERIGHVLVDGIAGPMAAAMPPCAQADEVPKPMGAAASTVTGRGASFSAQNSRPAPHRR